MFRTINEMFIKRINRTNDIEVLEGELDILLRIYKDNYDIPKVRYEIIHKINITTNRILALKERNTKTE